MKPSGAHTHPEMRGSGGGNGWLILVGAIVLAVVADPVARAISDLIEALAIIMAVLLAAAGLAAVLARRARHRYTRPLAQRRVRTLQAPEPPALGRAHEGTPPLPPNQRRGCDRHHHPAGQGLRPARHRRDARRGEGVKWPCQRPPTGLMGSPLPA